MQEITKAVTFRPPRRNGMLLQLGVIFILGTLSIIGLQATAQTEIGTAFLVALLPTLLILSLLPIFVYRTYALWAASYTIERDGLCLQWGLRIEEIPMHAIQWIHPLETLEYPVFLPWPRWEGAILGTRRMHDGKTIEFLASQSSNLLLIATDERIFAISPLDPGEFLQEYQNQSELGSFTNRASRSIQPTAIFAYFWPDRRARALVLGILTLNLVLLIWVSLIVPKHATTPFRFDADGNPLDVAPGGRLMLLPVISILINAVDLLLGLFFYHRAETKSAAYMVWLTGLVASWLFGGAVYFLL